MLKLSKRSIIIVLVAVLIVWGVWGSFSLFYRFSGKSDSTSIEMAKGANLIIKTNLADIFITGTNSDRLQANSTKAGDIITSKNGNDVIIELKDRRFLAGGFLSLEVPMKLSTVTVNAEIGDIDIGSINTDSLVIGTSTGDLTLTNIEASRIEARTHVGDIDMDSTTAIDCINLFTNAGDVSLSNISAHAVKAETMAGDIDLEGESIQQTEVRTSVGDIVIDTDLEKENGTFTITASDIYLFDSHYSKPISIGKGENIVNAESTVGTIKIE